MLVLMANYGAPTGGWVSAGRSAVWRPDGRLLAEAPASGEAVIVAGRLGTEWGVRVVGGDGRDDTRG
jgi:predicted amidohydrolase